MAQRPPLGKDWPLLPGRLCREAVTGCRSGPLPLGLPDEAGLTAHEALEPKSHRACVWSQRAAALLTLPHPLGGKGPRFSFPVTAEWGGGRGGRRKGEEKGGSQEGWEASGDSPAAPGASGWSGRRLLRAAARGQAVPEAAGAGEVFGVFPGLYSSRGSPSLGWAEVCRCAASLRSYGMLPPPPATPTP